MELIGTIVRLQIQRSSLKVDGERFRRYDPAPLFAVERLQLTPAGVVAEDEAGESLIDVHNAHHPGSKHRDGINGVSVGFTSHYAAMRDRFGPHLPDGIAGENILITADRRIAPDEVAAGLMIETAAGKLAPLAQVIVAAPCVEFSRFALRFPETERPDRTVTEAIQFLDNGLRGYYAASAGPETIITIGARVYHR